MKRWMPQETIRALAAAASSIGPESPQLTLDQLRADLSHEIAAKLARISGILSEWKHGRFHDRDPADIRVILADIRMLHLRHARIAAGSLRTFSRLVQALVRLQELHHDCASAWRKRVTEPQACARAEAGVPRLARESRKLVEAMSLRYGIRFGEIVTGAAEEIRREDVETDGSGISFVIDDADGGAATWIPRSDSARWRDILRNLIRNAVQAAVEGSRDTLPRERAQEPLATRKVTVRLRPARGRSGACVEIIDDGVGMDAEQMAAMWRDGSSRHGPGHGEGLTEEKRVFIERNAALEVRSLPGVGTCARIELPSRDIVFQPPTRWASPPLMIASLLGIMICSAAVWQMRHTEMVSVDVTNERLVEAVDRRGHVLWHRKMEDVVAPNYHSSIVTERPGLQSSTPQLVVRDERNGPMAILSTIPVQGPGRAIAIGTRGQDRWEHPLRWIQPITVHTGNLKSAFQAETIWNENGKPAVILNVRDGNWGSTSIQFFSLTGDSLGAYYHPGHLEFVASGDFDDDRRTEILLNGKNNRAAHGTMFWPGESRPDAYAECLVMLETPEVNGQAYPYNAWSDMPPAREEAYLLIPPLREDHFAWPHLMSIDHASFGVAGQEGHPCMTIQVGDGRIYSLDSHLRPLSCGVGDHTIASELAPTRAAAPLLYFRHGKPESIELIVQRGS